MTTDVLLTKLHELIALKAMLDQNETAWDRLGSRVRELRKEIGLETDRRYGDLFHLLVAADMLSVDYDNDLTCFNGTCTDYGDSLDFNSREGDEKRAKEDKEEEEMKAAWDAVAGHDYPLTIPQKYDLTHKALMNIMRQQGLEQVTFSRDDFDANDHYLLQEVDKKSQQITFELREKQNHVDVDDDCEYEDEDEYEDD